MEWEDEAIALLTELDAAGDTESAQVVADMIKARQASEVYRMNDNFTAAISRLDATSPDMAQRLANTYNGMGRQLQVAPNAGRVESAARGAIQGGTFGFADEILGTSRAALDVTGLGRLGDNIVGAGVHLLEGEDASERFANRIRAERGERHGQNLSYWLDRERQLNRTASESNPVTYGAAEIGSGIATGVVGGSKAIGKELIEATVEEAGEKGTTRNVTKNKLRDKSMQVGAAGGAAAGLGYSDLELDGSNSFDAVLNTTLGAVGGGAIGRYSDRILSPIGRGLGAVGRATSEVISPKRRMARAIANDLDDDGVTLAQAQQQIDEGRRRGQELILPDVVPSTRERLGSAMQSDGSAVKDVTEFLTARQRGQRDRVVERLFRTLGDDDILETYEDAIGAAKQSARPMYEDAYKIPVRRNKVINDILEGEYGQYGLERAAKLIDADVRAGELSPSVVNNSEMAQLHYVIQAMRDIGSESGSNVTRRQKTQSQMQAKKLSDALKEQNTPFRVAQKIYSDEFSNEKAIEFGSKLWNMPARRAEARFRQMSESEKMNARIAFVDDVIERLGRKRDQSNQVMDFDKDSIRRKMKLLFGDEMEFDEFFKAIGDEDAMAATFNRALHGSKTAANLARSQFVGDLRSAGTLGLMVGAYSPGMAIPAAASAVLGRQGNREIARRTNQLLTESLTSPNPEAYLAELLPSRYGVSIGGIRTGQAAIGGGGAAVQNPPPPNR